MPDSMANVGQTPEHAQSIDNLFDEFLARIHWVHLSLMLPLDESGGRRSQH
jgi:hypothetical protein